MLTHRMSGHRVRALGATALALALGTLTACGGDEQPSAGSGPTTEAGQPSASASPTPSTTTTPTTTTPKPTARPRDVLDLTAPSPRAARCLMPDAAMLKTLETPFRGTVTSVQDGVAVFAVDRHYDDSTFATVRVSFTGSDSGRADGWIDLTRGGTYLVATSRGEVVGCGFSGPVEPRLTRMYDRAFGAR